MPPSDWTSPEWVSWTVNELRRIVWDYGGSLKAVQVVRLYNEDPGHREVVTAAGGLKKFCLAHPRSLEWVSGPGPGHEVIKAKEELGHLNKTQVQPGPGRASPAEQGASCWSKPARPSEEKPGEPSKKRVPRLAAAFAGTLVDCVKGPTATKDELWDAWAAFCQASDEASGGFGRALYLLVRWRVLAPAGPKGFGLLGKTDSNYRKRHPMDREGALEGERPQFSVAPFVCPVPLYRLPDEFLCLTSLDVHAMQSRVHKILTEGNRLVPNAITTDNFQEYQHAVLFAEELQMKYDISLYDLVVEATLPYDRRTCMHKVWVPGLAEKRPSVLRGDAITLTCKQGKFAGYVHEVLLESVGISFHRSFTNKPPFKVHFDFNRTPLQTMHRAIDELSESLMVGDALQRPRPERHADLNEEQASFLSAAMQKPGGASGALPILLWGPPGTGKTTTVVHTIFAILRKHASAKILVCAPSNPAADLLCERLAKLGVKSKEMLRLVAMMRDPKLIPTAVKAFTQVNAITGCFCVPPVEDMQAKRVIVATCTAASYIRSRLKMPSGSWFTHVFVDEAAQAMEAEALVPLTLAGRSGRRFLAGDFKQLGPVIRSPVAIAFGLELSLMERIKNNITVDHSRVFTLLDTYRAHTSILKLYNKTVYGDVLRCRSPASSSDMEGWPECPRLGNAAHPVIFHNCDGEETRTKDSPSWQNTAELDEVKKYLMKLLAYGVQAEDIGIISPYHKQCQRLNFICKGEGVDVEVGTTELFQGREKRIIIISTVRSRQQEEVKNDFRFALGFLGSYKRTNVALSRARSMLIVVGNMTLLSNDHTWHNVIKLVRDMGCMRGQPFELQRPTYGESSEWGHSSLGAGASQGAADGAVDRPWRDPL